MLPVLLLGLLQDLELRAIAEAAAKGDYAAAEALSLERVKREPPSPRAWFYLGYARAAQGRFAEAVEPYQKAIELGLDDPKARLQLGYAAHRAGRHELAVDALRALPENDEARYYHGASLLELGRKAEAVDVLAPLAEKDGPWKELARVQRERAAPPKIWAVQALLKAGYDSNVLLLPETSLARGSEEGAAFLMTYGSAELSPLEPLTLRAGLLDVRYDDLAEADIGALLGEIEGRAELSDVLRGALSLHADAVRLGHDPLFRGAGPEAKLIWRADPALEVEAAALGTSKRFSPDEFKDLDGTLVEGKLELRWKGLAAAYRLSDENAEAEEFDVLSHRGDARLTVVPADGWELRAEGWIVRSVFGDDRKDLRRGARATAAWTPAPGVQLFLEGELERSGSTEDEFDYSRRLAAAGLIVSF